MAHHRFEGTGRHTVHPAAQEPKEAALLQQTLYKQRHKIEIMFGRTKDWRRIAMRYDRCAHTFISAICTAATVIFYLKE
ncbi:MAG: transposase [Nitrospira sp.]